MIVIPFHIMVVAELIQLIRDGVRDASPEANIIVWNWSWNFYEANPCPTIVNALPDDIILMAGFERGGRKKILGKMRVIDEYSLGYVGPSPTFRKCWTGSGSRLSQRVRAF